MKILVVGDIHICKAYSLIQSQGEKFSTRLEGCIKSINWAEDLAVKNSCDAMVYLGDTFNTPELDDETLTAIQEIKWNSLMHYFLCGNHESSIDGLRFNSVKALEAPNRLVISEVGKYIDQGNTRLHFLPYVTEIKRKALQETLSIAAEKKNIVFSHNDLKNVQMGMFISKEGYDLNDILNKTDLFLNGHLHNGSWVAKNRVLNVGILTGQRLDEDANKYPHNVYILDTETLVLTAYENPYAFNFYKIDVNSLNDLEKLSEKTLKNNAIVSVKCANILVDAAGEQKRLPMLVNERIQALRSKILESRCISIADLKDAKTVEHVAEFSIDYLQEFKAFVLASFGESSIVLDELNNICGG